ncbi:MAG: MEKHLA domain-containing protein [Cyanobacteria bacterium RI_101]|nr:MEKHLA domain-containing protein [Cyanobacteria bacterium RI_101]
MTFPEPGAENQYLAPHIRLLKANYKRRLGQPFGFSEITDPAELAQAIYEAPYLVLSHNAAADPVFTYGNLAAQKLFDYSWKELTQLPSRLSAEPPEQGERERFLATVSRQGFAIGYSGVRINRKGRRFLIQDATVWNLEDSAGAYQGQAALCHRWQWL